MKEIILAIESSCDETAMCLIDRDKNIIAHKVNSQAQDFKHIGGVVPELASRKHVDNIFYVFNELLEDANLTIKDINYIAVTTGPGLIGALLVGVNFANSLSLLYDIPIIAINHMQAHIYAITKDKEILFPHLSLIISGGHTDLVYLENQLDFNLIGQTKDDAVGECFDKVARIFDLGYPGGPKIEQLAKEGYHSYDLPLPLNDGSLDFSFSGLKSACFNLINQAKMKNQEININDFCKSFQDTVIDILSIKLEQAIKQYQPQSISVVGGVSCNNAIRTALSSLSENVIFPDKELTTDNAMMVGLLATYYLDNNVKLHKYINANPTINVEYTWN